MDLEDYRIPRQRFIAGAGVALAATTVAACAGSDNKPAASSEASSSEAASPTGGAAAPTGGVQPMAITTTADVPVGSGVIVDDIVVTQPTAGDFKGLSAKCPHKGCTVNEVVDGNIVCPCHGSRFNLDGTVAKGPAESPLAPVNIAVEGDSIVAT